MKPYSFLFLAFTALNAVAQEEKTSPDRALAEVKGNVKSIALSVENEKGDGWTLAYCTPCGSVIGQTTDEETSGITFDSRGNFTQTFFFGEREGSVPLAKTAGKRSFEEKTDTYTVEVRRDWEMHLERFCAHDNSTSERMADWPFLNDMTWIFGGDDMPEFYTFTEYVIDGYAKGTVAYEYRWETDGALLRSMVVTQNEGQDNGPLATSVVYFTDYKFDKHGNWISRKAKANTTFEEVYYDGAPYGDFTPTSSSWEEQRKIVYY